MATVNQADLQAFLEAAGRSLTEAQGSLGSGVQLVSDMVMSEAQLEVKAAVTTDAAGKVTLQPIAAADLAVGKINADALSTVRVSFVATASESLKPTASPKRKPADVIQAVRERVDIQRLVPILGDLTIEPMYIPASQRWLITARDAKGRIVRETIEPDDIQGGPR
ncbi:MAG: hypothetical protein JNM70_20370 [Anaerolineae bacterium]|nr:hypothetical protein [Anaerolineae bacterium]